MITLAMIIAWMIPTLITLRYTAYAENAPMLTTHEFELICSSCRCTKCGYARNMHSYGRRGGVCGKSYNSEEGWEGMHPLAFFVGLIEALLWPITLVVYGVKVGLKSSGVDLSFQYFKPPPEIKTREERRAKREAEKDERMRALEKRNSELERQLGIGA